MKTTNSIENILANLGFDALNHMQETALTTILEKRNVILLSPTGSGKTLAYLLPVFRSLREEVKEVQCLIIAPSRELVLQIEQVWKKMKTGYKVNVCYGGHSLETEQRNLSNPPAVLIGTPGRLKDHLDRGSFNPRQVRILVLDEFDKSLQLGFREDMEDIISPLIRLEKRILTSATSDVEIPGFTGVTSPKILDFTKEEQESDLAVKLVLSPEKDKIESLFQLICSIESEPTLIFSNHRESAERIAGLLNEKGIRTGYYHGGMEQEDRERILIRFRNGSLNYLATTDLAARGLDIPEVKNVIHYHLPLKQTDFLHRNGRTARMNAFGTAYILLHTEETKPEYIPRQTEHFSVKKTLQLPPSPAFQTIYISGGKKNKLSKGDIAGFFLQQGKLDKADLGLIEVKDFISFAAVRADRVESLLKEIEGCKLKGKKYKIEIAASRI
jgi:Superfamily II DNA and RNA helicases